MIPPNTLALNLQAKAVAIARAVNVTNQVEVASSK
jgi:hypothetical protein